VRFRESDCEPRRAALCGESREAEGYRDSAGSDETLPVTKAECKKCGNVMAYYWMMQTRSADEPSTRFYRCTKCNHTWREYE
jgi:transcription factor S